MAHFPLQITVQPILGRGAGILPFNSPFTNYVITASQNIEYIPTWHRLEVGRLLKFSTKYNYKSVILNLMNMC